MIRIEEKKNCCGCSACAQICPEQCISMERDEEEFSYPRVDEDRCVNCGLCERVCPELAEKSGFKGAFEKPIAYGGWNKNEEVRKRSSSGGAFSLFAHNILSLGGSVYGCILDKNLNALHTRAADRNSLEAMRGSKYIQSKIGQTYERVWEDLA